MMAGLPVVSTDVGGVPEVVEHGATGLLAPAGDAMAIAAALVRVAADASLRADLAATGVRRAMTRFSEDHMIAQYTRIYDEMLAGKRGAPLPSHASRAEAV
jgi:glycosyltransferase involved in cell wall biosynthesis